MRMERRIFIVAGALLLALRFAVGARDPMGYVLHVYLYVTGVRLLPRAEKYGEAVRPLLRYALLPLAIFVLALNVFFAPQVMLPFVAAITLIALAIPVWVADRTTFTVLVVTLSLPLILWCGYGAKHAMEIIEFRTLDAADVEAIRFRPDGHDKSELVLRDRARIEAFCAAVRDLSPYAPNHDRFYERPSWRVDVMLRGGDSIELTAGFGTRLDPRTAWLQFQVETYDSLALSRLMQTLPLPRNPAWK